MWEATRKRARIPLSLIVAIAFLVVQDSLTRLGLQGGVTVAIGVALIFIGLGTLTSKRSVLDRSASSIWMSAFVIWATFLLCLNPNVAGVQNVLVWFIFPATIAVTYARSAPGTFARAYPWWKWAGMVSSAIYLAMVAVQGPGASNQVYSDRGAGWLCLIALILVIPRIVLHNETWLPALVMAAAVVLSLSRTPLGIVVALLVVAFSVRPRHGASVDAPRAVGRMIFYFGIVVGAAVVLVLNVPALLARFVGGDNYSVGGFQINTSGRFVLWRMTIENWQRAPWLGHGPGNVQALISAAFPGRIDHPHNEYLRLLNDTGVVGLVLWSIGIVVITTRVLRALRQSKNRESQVIHIGALLGLVVLLAGATTDNITISVFSVMLIGSIVGLSFARHRDELEGLISPTEFVQNGSGVGLRVGSPSPHNGLTVNNRRGSSRP